MGLDTETETEPCGKSGEHTEYHCRLCIGSGFHAMKESSKVWLYTIWVWKLGDLNSLKTGKLKSENYP